MRKGDMHEILAEGPVFIVDTLSLSCPDACILTLKLDRVLTMLHVPDVFACLYLPFILRNSSSAQGEIPGGARMDVGEGIG